MVFPKQKIAVFVDGCFWHQCPLHSTRPKNNMSFWAAKLDRNVRRDQENTQALENAGWIVLRFWEHEVEESLQTCTELVTEAVLRRTRKIGGPL